MLASSRRTGVFLLLAFLLVSSAWVVHANSRHIDDTYVDEFYILWRGLNHLDPFGEPNRQFKIGETTRWFMRLLYPGALYYVNSHLGGVKSAEDGAFHLGKYRESSEPLATENRRNPVIQDFIFSMRVAFALLAVGCFCLVLWALLKHVNLAAAAAYGALLLNGHTVVNPGDNIFSAMVGPIVLGQFLFFYTETTLFILFSLAAFLCLQRDQATHGKAACLGVLAAAALSTKMSGVVIAAPLLAYVAFGMGGGARPPRLRFEVFFLFFAAFLFLINVNSPSFLYFIEKMLWNVYHYKAGHHGYMEAGGMEFFRYIMRDTGYFAIPLFLAALAWLARAPRARLAFAYVLGIAVIFTLWSFSDSVLYLPRNSAFLYVAMSFIIALAVGDLVGKTLARRPAMQAGATLGLLLVFVAVATPLAAGLQPLREAFLTDNKQRIQGCKTIGAVGLAKADLRLLRENAIGAVTALPGLRGVFNHRGKPVSERTSRMHLDGARPRHSLSEKMREALQYDCLVAYRQGQTRQLTNFLAMQHYSLPSRIGRFFFFVRNKKTSSLPPGNTSHG